MTDRGLGEVSFQYGERDRHILRPRRHRLQQGVQQTPRLYRAGDMHRRLGHQFYKHSCAQSTGNDQLDKLHSHGSCSRRSFGHAGVHTLRFTHEHQNRTAGQQEYLCMDMFCLFPLHIQSDVPHNFNMAGGYTGCVAIRRNSFPTKEQNMV